MVMKRSIKKQYVKKKKIITRQIKKEKNDNRSMYVR